MLLHTCQVITPDNNIATVFNVVYTLRKDIILVESYKPKQKYVPPKHWIAGLKLTVLDRDVILSPTGMLNDSLINAAQKLLKIQFPSVSGLQDVELGLCMSFKYESGELFKLFILY